MIPFSLTDAQRNVRGNRASGAPRAYTPAAGGSLKLGGVDDLAKAPKVVSQAQTNKQSDAPPDRMTSAERQAYWNSLKTNPRVTNPTPTTRSANDKSPSFVGGGVSPLLVRSVDGLTSAQSSEDWTRPDQAIATDLSYVMEGVNSAIAIYRASTGALQYGPYSAQSFFAPVYHAGDTFTTPQMYYDVMRDRWIIAYLEYDASETFSYIDIAVSVSNSPTQPNPGGQYYIYQQSTSYFEPTGNEPSYCLFLTMGVDYWGLYFTCTNFRGFGDATFVGNTMYAVNKGPMMTGAHDEQLVCQRCVPSQRRSSVPAQRLDRGGRAGRRVLRLD